MSFSLRTILTMTCLIFAFACVPTMDEAAAPVESAEATQVTAVTEPVAPPAQAEEPAPEVKVAAAEPAAARTQKQQAAAQKQYTPPAKKLDGALSPEQQAKTGIKENLPDPPAGAYLRLVTPNGPEAWPLGSTQTIEWETRNLDGMLQIQLYKFGQFLGVLAHSVPAEAGQWQWKIPKGQGAGGNYNIRIVSKRYKDVADSGEAEFELTFP